MQLFSHEYGSGAPLIILHGLLGSLDNWHSLSKRFGEHYHVFAVDQRNHGRSPHSEIFTYEAMREDLREFYAQHGISRAFLLGHSMGGKTAMEFALAYPDLVGKLVVVDIAPRAYPPHHDDLFNALSSLDLSTLHTRREVDDALGQRISSIPVRMFLMKNLKRTGEGQFAWKMNLPVIRAYYSEVNRAISGKRAFPNPTLFIRALAASYIEQSDEDDIVALFPQARIVEFDTGHWVHAESPEPFYRAVKDFLQG